MKFSYDKTADAIAITFKNVQVVRDEMLVDNIFAGFAKDGSLVQLQILDISDGDDTWLSVELVAKILGKSERTILRWINQGNLKAKKVGKEYKIRPEDIEGLAS